MMISLGNEAQVHDTVLPIVNFPAGRKHCFILLLRLFLVLRADAYSHAWYGVSFLVLPMFRSPASVIFSSLLRRSASYYHHNMLSLGESSNFRHKQSEAFFSLVACTLYVTVSC